MKEAAYSMLAPSTSDGLVRLTQWAELSPAEQAAVRGLSLTPQQIEFAGTVEAAIAQCQEKAGAELAGLAILCGAVVVGFLTLKRGSQAPAWAPVGAVVVSALRIDTRQQGRGLGTAALELIPSWVIQHWSPTKSIVLSVDEENVSGIKSYLKAGWVDDGIRVQGRIGWVRHMTMHLTAPDSSNSARHENRNH